MPHPVHLFRARATALAVVSLVVLTAATSSAQAPTLVRDITPGSSSTTFGSAFDLNGTLVFVANDGVSGNELWKSDGTTGGTSVVKDIYPGATGSNPDSLTLVNGTLFFTADDGVHGRELWKTNGTTAGTVLVKDVKATGGSNPNLLTDVNGTLYFIAFDTSLKFWRSDGTGAGTVAFWTVPLPPGGSPCGISLFRDREAVGSTLFFSFCQDGTGHELWKTDGTAAGSVLVKDIYPGASDSEPDELLAVNGVLYFGADDGVHGRELWTSNGTAAGTTLVKDINPGANGSGSGPGVALDDGTVYLIADDGTHGFEPWRSDGTALGTVLVKDITPGAASTDFTEENAVALINGILYFTADDGVSGSELWKSDGTADGTILVKDIVVGVGSSSPSEFAAVGPWLFFAAASGGSGRELWTSDGTAAGTVQVADIRPGAPGSEPQSLIGIIGTLFFTADDGVAGRELWKLAVPLTPVLDELSAALRIGASNTLTGSEFTPGSVIKLFVSSGGGSSAYGPYTPTAWTPTSLTWNIPASVPLGDGFGSVQVVNTDQGYTVSNVVGALLEGDAADNIPTILYINGQALSPVEPGIPVAHVDTTITTGSTVTIVGTGFNQPGVNLYTAAGNVGPLWPLAGATDTQIQVQVPLATPTGPGNFQVINHPYTGNVASNAVSAVIGARPSITSVTVLGSTVRVDGTGFCSLSVINLFNLQGGLVVNLGGLNGATPNVPLTVLSSTLFTFTLPAGALAGPAFVQVLNPPYIPYASSGNDPDGAFTIP